MKKILAFLLFIISSNHAFSQDATWVTTVGGANWDGAYGVTETNDGGFAVTGWTTSFGIGGRDLILQKFDASGIPLWTRTIGSSGSEIGVYLAQMPDGALVVAGRTDSFGAGSSDFLLTKFDPQGNHVWTRVIGGSGLDDVQSVVETPDGGFALTGRTYSFGAGNRDLLLVKLDASGNHVWTRTVGGSGVEEGTSIIETSDGGIVVSGITTSFGAGSCDYLLAKFDLSGNLLWARTIGGSGNDQAISVVEASDGCLVVTGASTSFGAGSFDLLIAKFNHSQNELVWARTLGGGLLDEGLSVAGASDGGFVVSGRAHSNTSLSIGDLVVAKFDALGNHLWTSLFSDDSFDWGRWVVESSDGNLVVTGRTEGMGAGSSDILLAKFDSYGHSCFGESGILQVQNVSPILQVYYPTVTQPTPNTAAWYPVVTDPIPITTLICADVAPARICGAFLTPKRVRIDQPAFARPVFGNSDNPTHDFKIHIIPCEPMNVSVGDSADVYVDVDVSGAFDDDENYLAVVSSTDLDTEAMDIAIKVYVGQDLIDNDPCVAIYSISSIPVVDTLGNWIDYLCLDTFDPHAGNRAETSDKPQVSSLGQNYPNPFNPACQIRYFLTRGSEVSLNIYNVTGQKVRTLVKGYQAAGDKAVYWDGTDDRGSKVASGIYFYRIQAGGFTEAKKMILMK